MSDEKTKATEPQAPKTTKAARLERVKFCHGVRIPGMNTDLTSLHHEREGKPAYYIELRDRFVTVRAHETRKLIMSEQEKDAVEVIPIENVSSFRFLKE